MKKKKEKKKDGRIKYPFIDMMIGAKEVIIYDTEKQRANARCAAHQISYNHGWNYETVNRTTDAGKFELTVTRIK